MINEAPLIAGPQPAAAGAAAAAVELAPTVEQQPNGGVVTTTPNGTPEKALIKARAAKTFRAYLPSQCHRTYSCVHCR